MFFKQYSFHNAAFNVFTVSLKKLVRSCRTGHFLSKFNQFLKTKIKNFSLFLFDISYKSNLFPVVVRKFQTRKEFKKLRHNRNFGVCCIIDFVTIKKHYFTRNVCIFLVKLNVMQHTTQKHICVDINHAETVGIIECLNFVFGKRYIAAHKYDLTRLCLKTITKR